MIHLPFFVFALTDEYTLFEYQRNSNLILSVQALYQRTRRKARSYNPWLPDYMYQNRFDYENQIKECGRQETNLSSYLCSGIKMLADKYLCYKNRHLYVKKEMHEEWMELVRICPPLIICAAFFLKEFKNTPNKDKFINQTLMDQFSETAQRIPYCFELENIVRKESKLRDMHIHLNGSTETDVLWWSQIGRVEKWIGSFRQSYYHDLMVMHQYEQNNWFPKEFFDSLRKGKQLLDEISSHLVTNDPVFKESWQFYYPYKGYPVLVKGAYFYLSVLVQIEQGNELLARKFHHLLLIISGLHQMIVQQRTQKGFTQFQMIPNNDIRWLHEADTYDMRFEQLLHDTDFCFLEHLEGRFAPKRKKEENIIQIKKITSDFQKIKAKIKKNYNADPHLGLVAHFIKIKDRSLDCDERHQILRKDIADKSIALISAQRYLLFSSYQYQNQMALVGIDAAANEMDAGPEVFAPAFRWLKRNWKQFSLDLRQTFHAGEDFVHLLSGLRMMYEAVEFLDMEQGDRIGHGTAAGILPSLWLERIEPNLYIKKGEWLDDLLLVYKWISDYSCPYENLRSKLPLVSDEIYKLSKEIYGDVYSIDELYQGWSFRRYDPAFYLKKKSFYIKDSLDEQLKIQMDMKQHPMGTRLFELYHYDSGVKKRYNELMRLHNGLFTAEELYQIQNLVLDYIAQKGIALEVPISSNLCISFYKNLDEHHLGRWIKGSSDHNLLIPAVVLGTDDPGIFMTNIYIEYARLMTYLEHKGYNISDRIEMILHSNRISNYYKF